MALGHKHIVMPPSVRLQRRGCHSGERGFTLIELMYAMGYFMFGLAAIVAMQIAAANGAARSADLMLATNLTVNAVETWRVTPLATMLSTPLSTQQFDRNGNLVTSNGYFTQLVSISAPTNAQPWSEVVVTTNWTSVAGTTFQHGVTMQTRIGVH